MVKKEPLKALRDFSRRAASEGMVLLENKGQILPLKGKVALYGRIQSDYYKSGTGSGGMVNVTDVPNLIEAFLENPRLDVNLKLKEVYEKWILENPFNAGDGVFGKEPWCQKEMELEKTFVEEVKRDDETPVMIIGRTAGEERDNYEGEGSYLLTKEEYNAIKVLKEAYGKVVVVLNVGNLLDMNFVGELDVDGILYAWHGGQDGARATVDVLTGYVTPSGKLPITSVKSLKEYPANKDFGKEDELIYEDDIYVGYRFFETFRKDDVLYPFGYGLSYSNFEINLASSNIDEKKVKIEVDVKNVGSYSAKEVVQLYLSAPQGKLGKPFKTLVAFQKTKLLKPNETTKIILEAYFNNMASYDDEGKIEKSSYILEKGEYKFFLGNSVKHNIQVAAKVIKDDIIVQKLNENLSPVRNFKRIKPAVNGNNLEITYEDVPTRTYDLKSRIYNNLPEEFKTTNEKHDFSDVYNEKISLKEFIGSLSIDDLKHLSMGEGMSSPKVTDGTASAFGGISPELKEKNIPVVCCADGPSGIRMDSGAYATSMPNGTLLASTFDPNLVTCLYELEGLELRAYNIDILLAPGMNIQRHPLCGRNFEYFSEDPLLTGIMAGSVVKGLNKSGVNGSLKHFAANNQETNRTGLNSIVSERALREIYLKGFEIAVKSYKAEVIMTSYNPINGIWAAGNYDLVTNILRNEWNYKGIVMTDWWAYINNDNDEQSRENLAWMVRAQNDIYQVVQDCTTHPNNLIEEYNKGNVTLGMLQRNIYNILSFVLKTPVFKKKHGLKIKKHDKKYQGWFKTNYKEIKYPYLDNTKITGFERKITEDEMKKFQVLENKGNVSYGIIEKDEKTLYTYGISRSINIDEVGQIIKNLEHKNVYVLPINRYDEIKIERTNYVYKNDVAKDSFEVIDKDSLYIYAIKAGKTGKYRISFEMSAEAPTIFHQMPLVIYVDEVNKVTLTPNGTNGKINVIMGEVSINKENKFVSFKFNKTGLTIHSIKISNNNSV